MWSRDDIPDVSHDSTQMSTPLSGLTSATIINGIENKMDAIHTDNTLHLATVLVKTFLIGFITPRNRSTLMTSRVYTELNMEIIWVE
jgi:hypothetical protein